jgi:hypothetical protein
VLPVQEREMQGEAGAVDSAAATKRWWRGCPNKDGGAAPEARLGFMVWIEQRTRQFRACGLGHRRQRKKIGSRWSCDGWVVIDESEGGRARWRDAGDLWCEVPL